MWKTLVQFLGWEDPLEEAWQSHGQEELLVALLWLAKTEWLSAAQPPMESLENALSEISPFSHGTEKCTEI